MMAIILRFWLRGSSAMSCGRAWPGSDSDIRDPFNLELSYPERVQSVAWPHEPNLSHSVHALRTAIPCCDCTCSVARLDE